jgi:hypothetical protein
LRANKRASTYILSWRFSLLAQIATFLVQNGNKNRIFVPSKKLLQFTATVLPPPTSQPFAAILRRSFKIRIFDVALPRTVNAKCDSSSHDRLKTPLSQ